MLIVLTGLQPTLWFADVRGADIHEQYRKFLFASVVHDGKPLLCAMCVVVGVYYVRGNSRLANAPEFSVRELGLGLTPVRYYQTVIGSRFATVREARKYAIRRAWEILSRAQTRELILHVADMYDEAHYKNWELVCL